VRTIIRRGTDGQTVIYESKNVILDQFTKEYIIEKRLYPYIPFYIARYEKELTNAESGNLESVINDLEYFRDEMCRLHEEGELSDYDYIDLTGFVNTIIRHITDGNKNEERLVKIMGGTVIETESERLIQKGKLDTLFELVKDNILTVSEAAARAGMTEAIFTEKMQRLQL
jgi:hypothetical protein